MPGLSGAKGQKGATAIAETLPGLPGNQLVLSIDAKLFTLINVMIIAYENVLCHFIRQKSNYSCAHNADVSQASFRLSFNILQHAQNSTGLMLHAPAYLAEYCRQAGTCHPGTRSADTSMLDVPRTRTALGDRSFATCLEQSATQHS